MRACTSGKIRIDLRLRGVPAAALPEMLLDLLIDRRVHEEREDDRCRTIDGHRYRGGGIAQIETRVEFLDIVHGGNRYPAVADLAVDIGPHRRVLTVERDRIKSRRQAVGRLSPRDVVKAPVGALRRALAGEHAGRILAFATVRKHAGRIGVVSRQVLLEQEHQQLAPAGVARGTDLGDLQATQALAVVVAANLAAAHAVAVLVAANPLEPCRPLAQQLQRLRLELVDG